MRPVPSGISAIDTALRGFPRGQLSEVAGGPSSGRTGLLLSLVAHATARGTLVAWVDPQDRFDPAAAAAAGSDLTRPTCGSTLTSTPSSWTAPG